jgi:hypothetical protein
VGGWFSCHQATALNVPKFGSRKTSVGKGKTANKTVLAENHGLVEEEKREKETNPSQGFAQPIERKQPQNRMHFSSSQAAMAAVLTISLGRRIKQDTKGAMHSVCAF